MKCSCYCCYCCYVVSDSVNVARIALVVCPFAHRCNAKKQSDLFDKDGDDRGDDDDDDDINVVLIY